MQMCFILVVELKQCVWHILCFQLTIVNDIEGDNSLDRGFQTPPPPVPHLGNPSLGVSMRERPLNASLWTGFANNGLLADVNIDPVKLDCQLGLLGCDVNLSAEL